LEVADVNEIIAFDYHWDVHTDHWGHWLMLTLACLEMSAHFRDNRHWDDKRNMPVGLSL